MNSFLRVHIFVILIGCQMAYSQVFYSVSANCASGCNFNNPANWALNPDGSGGNAGIFSTANGVDRFVIQSGDSVFLTNNLPNTWLDSIAVNTGGIFHGNSFTIDFNNGNPGEVSLTNAGKFYSTSGNMIINGEGGFVNTGTFYHRNGTVSYTRNANIAVASVEYFRLVIGGGSTKTAASGTLTVADSLIITAGTFTLLTNNTNLVLNAARLQGGTLNLGNNTTTMTATHNVIMNGGNITSNGAVSQYNSALIINLGTFNGNSAKITIQNLTMNGGAFNASSDTVFLNGTFTRTAGTFTPGVGTNTFCYNGSSSQTVLTSANSVTYRHLLLRNSSKTTNAGTLTISATLNVENSASLLLNVNNTALTSSGAVTVASGSSIIAGSGTLILNGAITNDGTITGSSGQIDINAGLTNNGTFTASSDTTFFTGNFINSGVFNHNNGTFVYDGTAQTVAAVDYHRLRLAGTSTKTIAAGTLTTADSMIVAATTTFAVNNTTLNAHSVRILPTFVLTQGTSAFTIVNSLNNQGTLTAGSGGITVGGNFLNSGTFTGSSGNLIVAGTAQNSGTLNGPTGTGKMRFWGNFTNLSGTFRMAGDTTFFHGDYIHTSGSLTNPGVGNRVIAFVRNGNQSVPAISGYINVFFDSSGTKTLTSGNFSASGTFATSTTSSLVVDLSTNNPSLVINGNTTIGSNTSLVGGAGQIDFNSALLNNGTITASSDTTFLNGTFTNNGTFNHNSGTFVYDGTTQTVVAVAYHNLRLANAGTKTIQHNTLVNAHLTIAGSATATQSGKLTVGGNLTISASTTLNASTDTTFVGGDFVRNGTMNPSTGTFAFNGSTNQTIAGGTYRNILLSGGGTKTFTSSFTANGDVMISGMAVLDANNLNHSVAGNWTETTSSAQMINSDTIFFTGTSTSTIGSSGAGVIAFKTIALPTSGKSLVFNSSGVTYSLSGTIVLPPCGGTASISGSPGAASIALASTITLLGATTTITNINVTSNQINANSGVDGGGNTNINFPGSGLTPSTKLFWIGGSGNWNSCSNWSTTSGGTPAGFLPTIADTVIFDHNSFPNSTNKTVTINNSIYGVRTLIFTDDADAPVIAFGTNPLEIKESLILMPNVSLTRVGSGGTLNFTASTGNVNIVTANVNMYQINFNSTGGSQDAVFNLTDSLKTTGFINVTQGTFNKGNNVVRAGGLMTIASGGTLTSGSGNIILQNGLTNNGTFTASSDTTFLSGGTFTNTGTFNHNNGTFSYNQAAAQTIITSPTYYNLDLRTSGTKTPTAGTLTVQGSLRTMNNVVLALNTNNTAMHVGGNLFQQNSSTITGGSQPIVIVGDFNKSGTTTFTASSDSTFVGGNFTNAGTFNHNNGTFVYNGTSAQTVRTSLNGVTYNRLVLTGGSTKTATSGNLTALGGIENRVGTTFITTSDTTFIGGDFINAGTFNHNNGHVIYNRNGAQAVAAVTYNRLEFTGTGAGNTKTTAAGTVSVLDSLILRNTAQLALNTNNTTLSVTNSVNLQNTSSIIGGTAKINIGGNLFMPAGTSFTASSDSTILNGNFIAGGTFSHNNGTFAYSGNGMQLVSTAVTYHNLALRNSGNKIPGSGTLTINNQLSLIGSAHLVLSTNNPAVTVASINNASTSSTITGGNGSITVSGNVTNSGTILGGSGNISVSGTFTNNGTFTGGSGKITVVGNFTNPVGSSFTASSDTTFVGANFTAQGTFSNNNGTFVYNGSGVQTVRMNITYHNLVLANASVKTVTAAHGGTALIVNGSLAVNNSATFNANNFNIYVGRHFNELTATAQTINTDTIFFTFNGIDTANFGGPSSVGIISVKTIHVPAGKALSFNSAVTYNINGHIVLPTACTAAEVRLFGTPGAASIALGNIQTFTGAPVRIQNLNITANHINAYTGINAGGNTNVYFPGDLALPVRILYRVGGSGDWNSCSSWSTSSGGAGNAIATLGDSLIFDANSFPNSSSNQTTITTNAYARSITFTDDADLPQILLNDTLEIKGNLLLLSNVSIVPPSPTSPNLLLFSASTGTVYLTTNGVDIFRADFNSSGATEDAVFVLQDALNVARNIVLKGGTLNTNGVVVNTMQLDASIGTKTRSLTLGNSTINLSQNNTAHALDLSATSGLTVNAGTSQINITNATGGKIQMGTISRTLYNVAFTGVGGNDTIFTNNANPHTFNNISLANDASLFVSGTSTKTYNAFTAGTGSGNANDITFNGTSTFNGVVSVRTARTRSVVFNNPVIFNANVNLNVNGTSSAVSANGVTFASGTSLTLGDSTTATFSNTNLFRNIAIGKVNTVSFSGSNTFSTSTNVTVDSFSTVTVANSSFLAGNNWTTHQSNVTYSSGGTFNGSMTFLGSGGTINFPSSVTFQQPLFATSKLVFSGGVTHTANSNFRALDSVNVITNNTVLQINASAPARIMFLNLNNAPIVRFNNSHADTINVVRLRSAIANAQILVNPSATLYVDSIVTTNYGCSTSYPTPANRPLVASDVTGTQFTMHLGTADSVYSVRFRDVNLASANLTAFGYPMLSYNLGNNTGIVFTGSNRELYWVSNAGDWNDGTRWSFFSGGAPSGCVPDSTTNVYFDAASFTSPSQIVTTSGNSTCANLNWSMNAASSLDGGSNPILRLDVPLRVSGNINFQATDPWQINSPNQHAIILSSSDTLRTIRTTGVRIPHLHFRGVGGKWTLLDSLVVDRDSTNGNAYGCIFLQAGHFDNNGYNIHAGFFNAYRDTNGLFFNNPRKLTIRPNTKVYLNGYRATGFGLHPPFPQSDFYAAWDFRNNGGVVNEPVLEADTSAEIIFTSGYNPNTPSPARGLVRVFFGNHSSKTYPSITTYGIDNDIFSEDGTTNLLTINHFSRLAPNTSAYQLFISGTSPKRFLGNIYFSSNMTNGDSTNIIRGSTSVENIVYGSVITGNNIGSFAAQQRPFIFRGTWRFKKQVIFGDQAYTRFDNGNYTIFEDSLVYGAHTNVNNKQQFAQRTVSTSLIKAGNGTVLEYMNQRNKLDSIYLHSEARLLFTSLEGNDTIRSIQSNDFNIISFAADTTGADTAKTLITGRIYAKVGCNGWIYVRSSKANITAGLMFSLDTQKWRNVTVQDIYVYGSPYFPVYDTAGTDVANNNGEIYFPANTVGQRFYWIGKGGQLNPLDNTVSNLWSNPGNWSQDSLVYNGNTCTPTSLDSVFITAGSFDGPNQAMIIDVSPATCRYFYLSPAVYLSGAGPVPRIAAPGVTSSEIEISGSFVSYANPTRWTNDLNGSWTFRVVDTSLTHVIRSNGEPFVTPIKFDAAGGKWILEDSLVLNRLGGVGRLVPNLTIELGEVDFNSKNVYCGGGFLVNNPSTSARFKAQNTTVTFQGGDNVNLRSHSTHTQNRFFNIRINKTSGAVILLDTLRFNRNLEISVGRLTDNGNQIVGTDTSQFIMAGSSELFIGGVNPTEFPLNIQNNNINLSATSTIRYSGNGSTTQNVRLFSSTNPAQTYGRIQFAHGGGSGLAVKILCPRIGAPTADGQNRLMYRTAMEIVSDGTEVLDSGYQIVASAGATFSMGTGDVVNRIINLGSAWNSTTFPVTDSSLVSLGSANSNTTVRYISGQLNQTVQALGRVAPRAYRNLVLSKDISQPGFVAGVVNKIANGELVVTRDLTVNTNTNLCDNGYQITGQAGRTLTLAAGAFLTLGADSTDSRTGNTRFPLGYDYVNDLSLNATSTVIYNGGTNKTGGVQYIARLNMPGGSMALQNRNYGNLIIRNSNPNPSAIAIKRISNDSTYKGPAVFDSLRVRGNLTIERFNDLQDSTTQIFHSTTGILTVDSAAFLTLGSPTVATRFPLNTASANINLHANSTVVYQSGINQRVRRLAAFNHTLNPERDYANLILRNNSVKILDTVSGTVVPAVLDADANNMYVRGRLTLDNSRLDLNNFRLTMAGTLSRQGTLSNATFTGSDNSRISILGNGVFADSSLAKNAIAFTNPTTTQLREFTVNRTASDSILLGSNLIVGTTSNNGQISLGGSFVYLNGHTLTLNSTAGNYVATTGGFRGSSTSSLVFNGTGNLGSNLNFAAGADTLQNLTINRTSAGGDVVTLGTNLNLVSGGLLTLASGGLNLNGNTLFLNGNYSNTGGRFVGSAASRLVVGGSGTLGNFVFDNSTTSNHTLKAFYMNRSTPDYVLGSNLIIADTLAHGSATLNINGNRLTINGVHTATTGAFVGSNTSRMVIGGTGQFDPLRMMQTSPTTRTLQSLTITRSSHEIAMANRLTVGVTNSDTLTLGSGAVLNINGDTLTINGQLANTPGVLKGSNTSHLIIGGSSSPLAGTLKFSTATTSDRTLRTLTLNRTGVSGNAVTLGSPLIIQGTNATLTLIAGRLGTSATNSLTLEAGASVAGAVTTGANYAGSSGGSDASYISGPVTKVFGAGENLTGTNQSFRFPVGKNGVLREIGIADFNNFSAGASFTAEYFVGTPPSFGAIVPGDMTHVSALEYWDLTRNATSTEPKVILSWNSASDVASNPVYHSQLRIAHRRGPAYNTWWSEGNEYYTGTPSAGYLVSSNHINSFSFFTLGSTVFNNPLPVTILEYNVEYVAPEAQVVVRWKTASGANSAGYIIRRSTDMLQWNEIASYLLDSKLRAKGENMNVYSYIDNTVSSGTYYYQLIEVSTNGEQRLSQIKVVTVANSSVTQLYQNIPNPVTHHSTLISFTLANDAYVSLKIVDMLGRTVDVLKDGELSSGFHEISYATEHLQTGVYMIVLEVNGVRFVKKMSVE
ncbi:MAG: hypothetical protein NZM38_05025 [Cytophagales bacterium]|nr:hypothetical protein [Cytophagales bacterium]MDW8384115.1 hypothetical protein [Flammeovirgaceae bacterium]